MSITKEFAKKVLEFSQKQLAAFEDIATVRLASSALEEVRRSSPHAMAGLSKVEISDRFERVLAKLPMYQFGTKEDLEVFVTLCFLVGPEFDQYPGFRSFPKKGEALKPYEFVSLLASEPSDNWENAAQFDVIHRYTKPPEATSRGPFGEVMLEILSGKHGDAFHVHALHPDVWRLGRMKPMLRVTEVMAYIDDQSRSNRVDYAAIGQDRQLLGATTGIYRGDHIEVRYWVARHLWGYGMGRRMLRQMTKMIAREDARPIRLIVHKGNAGSIKVAKASGFSPTPTPSPEHYVFEQ